MLLKRLQPIAYLRGDLISLAGYLGEETFDYPYLIVKEDFISEFAGGEARTGYYQTFPYLNKTELVYPPWREEMSYSLNEFTKQVIANEIKIKWKYLDWGLDWKVWYNGLLYESTKWTQPNVGVPPNQQVTNSGDSAGFQPNLNGELGFDAVHPNPKGYATTIKNQSHTFRSWIISEKQPTNPFWEYSNNLSYFVYNNYKGDDTPQGEYTYSREEHTNSRIPAPVDENGVLIPDPNRFPPVIRPLPNVFEYNENPNLGGFAVGQLYNEVTEDWYEGFIVSGEGREFDYRGKPIKQYRGWSIYGFNPWTGELPQKNTVCPNPYSPMNTSYNYSWEGLSSTHTGFRSCHMFKESFKTTYALNQTEEGQNPIRSVVNPAYPPDDQLAITAVQDFPYLLDNYLDGHSDLPISGEEIGISTDGGVNFRFRLWGGGVLNKLKLPPIETLIDEVTTASPVPPEDPNPYDTVGNWLPPRTNTRTYTESRKTENYLYLEAYHPLFWLRKVAILENKGYFNFSEDDSVQKSYVTTFDHPQYGAIPTCVAWNLSNSKDTFTYKGWIWRELERPTFQSQTKNYTSNNLGASDESGRYYNNTAFQVGGFKTAYDVYQDFTHTEFYTKEYDLTKPLPPLHGCGDLIHTYQSNETFELTGQGYDTFKFLFP